MAKLEQSTFCPLVKKNCLQLGCSWYTKIAGMDPQTGKEIEDWGCAIAWLPALLINTAKESYQTSAAVESFRNEMVRENQESREVLAMALTKAVALAGSVTLTTEQLPNHTHSVTHHTHSVSAQE